MVRLWLMMAMAPTLVSEIVVNMVSVPPKLL